MMNNSCRNCLFLNQACSEHAGKPEEEASPKVTPISRASDPPNEKTPTDHFKAAFVDSVIAEINKKYFAIKDYGGHFRIGWFEPDNIGGFKGEILRTMSFDDFSMGLANQTVQIGEDKDGNPKFGKKSKYWLEHPDRLEYDKVVFKPNEQVPENVRNLWNGFAYEPENGDCSLYLSHVKENICQGDEELYDWLIKWMAYQVRHPEEQGQSAIAVNGEKGVGKNVFAEGFAKLFGHHAIIINDSTKVTRNFNHHLWNKCIVIADEAFFAGDPRPDRVLKGYITGSTLNIEPKGVDSFSTQNRLRFIIIGNDEQLVRATCDERRYLMLECGKAQQKKTPYFKAIQDQLEKNDGYEALLYHLLHEVDLSGFDVRNPPHTDALRKQMEKSHDPAMDVIQECLMSGQIPGVPADKGSVMVNLAQLANWAVKLRPQQWGRVTRQSFRSIVGDKGLDLRNERLSLYPGEKRSRQVKFPRLDQARRLWNARYNPIKWDDDDPDWEPITVEADGSVVKESRKERS